MWGYAKLLAALALCVASPAFSQPSPDRYVTPPACGFACSRGESYLPLMGGEAPRENWIVSTRSNDLALRDASKNTPVARFSRGAVLGLSDVGIRRLADDSDLVTIKGDLTNSGLAPARISSVDLLLIDAEGKLLRTVTADVGATAIVRGAARPFQVRFAMNQASADPVRVEIGRVRLR